ncbi:hypothetical protein [Paracoccus siganidrum]|uniref:Uncharacterized protein n=1 Tax=Paracoccus siganidrum TaxID=1276757 RepID=A0A418ZUL3_9RHOB|nr:hypothetical protein [Paracoccus siganidrum]RJL02364.1 hypothetical protein D3P05_21795 [Paracoccus siganidrum]RMC30090.1 hypothetical protein C9E82_18930 [Paracoccus siganidrum]
MSFADCVGRAVKDGHTDAGRGKRAQAMWSELADRYEAQGRPRDVAEALAAEDVKRALKKEAGDKRHTYIKQLNVMRRLEAEVDQAKDLATLATNKIEHMAAGANPTTSLVGQANGLRRMFHHRLADLLVRHSRDLKGNIKDPAGLMNVVRELHGESTGDAAALAMSKSVRDVFKDMRRMFNEAGGVIGELDDWGLPHVHNRLAITSAGFDTWSRQIDDRIAWHRIEDKMTGKPFASEGQKPPLEVRQRFLREIYDNIAFGRDSQTAVYGRVEGKNLVNKMAESRVLHFNTADDWIAYNKDFGTGNPYASIIAHAHRMADQIVQLREYGPSPELGLDYQRQLALKKAREAGDEALAGKIEQNFVHASRMLRIQNGGIQPASLRQAQIARFFSSLRHFLTAAMLDRAVIASLSDANSMRMAARSIGMNPANPFQRHMSLITSGMAREEALRAGWVADTLADAGLVLARWQSEVPPADIAERMSSFVMRAQGLSHWTDTGRNAFQMEMSGLFAANAGRKIDDIDDIDEPLRTLLRNKNISDDDWRAFTDPETMFRAGNGATFASPIYWREATTMDPSKADDLFLKLQALLEEQTEFAVPTQSLWARAHVEADAIPGTIDYEIRKSGLMVKSFAMTFTVDQISRIMSMNGWQQRALYGFDLAAGSTVLGATSLLIADLINGRDPSDMTKPMFWAEAMAKGGGFGVIGDIVATGESSWGGGYGSWVAGPGFQLMDDVWRLSVGNAIELMGGQETKAGREFVRFLKRYTPGSDLPYAGLAIDRLVWSSLQRLLDPEAEEAFTMAARRNEKDGGSPGWWLPGSPAPGRAPDVMNALGR